MNLTRRHLFALTAISLLIISTGCSDRDPTSLEQARANTDPVVFDDEFSYDVYFQPFFETHYTAMSIDSVYAYEGFAPDGARSIKFNIPPAGSALGPYTGGVLTPSASRDLTDYNALTFYARTNELHYLDVAGFGNDNTGNSLYDAGRKNIPLTSEWTFVIVPIPSPSKIVSERGLFTIAESTEEAYPGGYDIWIDELRFAKLGNILDPISVMPFGNKQYFIGSTASLDGTYTTYRIDGAPVRVDHSPNYFDFVSSDNSVAVVQGNTIAVVGEGSATITGTLSTSPSDTVAVNGRVVLTGYSPPANAAISPTLPAGDVISMFSDVYNDVPVDAWNTYWGGSTAQTEDYQVNGDNTKMYSTLNYVGIEFRNPTINASEMTHFHLDVYAPEGSNFKVKLVSFPPELSGGVETTDLIFDAGSTPSFASGSWQYLDIPVGDFQLPANWDWGHIGQLVLSTNSAQLVLVDNVYWHK